MIYRPAGPLSFPRARARAAAPNYRSRTLTERERHPLPLPAPARPALSLPFPPPPPRPVWSSRDRASPRPCTSLPPSPPLSPVSPATGQFIWWDHRSLYFVRGLENAAEGPSSRQTDFLSRVPSARLLPRAQSIPSDFYEPPPFLFSIPAARRRDRLDVIYFRSRNSRSVRL